MKAYSTSTDGKNFKTAHCIVSLYRSVSSSEKTPSGVLVGGIAEEEGLDRACSWRGCRFSVTAQEEDRLDAEARASQSNRPWRGTPLFRC